MPDKNTDLIAGLVADLRPVAPLAQRQGMALAMLGLATGAAGIIALFGLRPDLRGGQPDAAALISAGLFLVLALASAWAVVDAARPYVGIRREGWGWTALMAAVLPAAALGLMAGNWLRGAPAGLTLNGLNCMLSGLGWGLLTGVAAGAAGIFAMSLNCPHNDVVHIGIWHGVTVILAGALGRLAIPRLIAW